jgi:hypothetical protein
MADTSIGNIEKRRGRPATNATPVLVRLYPDELAKVDARRETMGPKASRPDAIRAMIAAAKG